MWVSKLGSIWKNELRHVTWEDELQKLVHEQVDCKTNWQNTLDVNCNITYFPRIIELSVHKYSYIKILKY